METALTYTFVEL